MNESPPRGVAQPFVQHDFSTVVRVIGGIPTVLLSRLAYSKMFHLADLATGEVSWMGTCYRSGKDFLIDDVFLVEQQVSTTTTEMTEDGLANLAFDLLEQENGQELLNALKFWGHSHGSLQVFASSQDEDQTIELMKRHPDFCIRAIVNRRGVMKFTICLGNAGLIIEDAPWRIYDLVDQSCRAELETEASTKVQPLPPPVRPRRATKRLRQGYGWVRPVLPPAPAEAEDDGTEEVGHG